MSPGTGRALRTAYVVAGVAGVAFFAMSVVLLGLWPGRVLGDQSRRMSPPSPLGLTVAEQRGREVYAREGCAYCHTQQVRYLPSDVERFGAPTLAWETQFDYPHLWGTRRIGPDLARAGATRSADWQYAHLFSPRDLVSGSVMPAYRSLFDGAPDRPRQEARDLVAYLETLGRARELAGPEGEASAREACDCPGDEMAQMAFAAPLLNAHPARARRDGDAPALTATGEPTRGRQLYAARCASCHGADGRGEGPGGVGLLPRPANLAEHRYTLDRLSEALWNGVSGTAMPAWRDHEIADLAAIARAVQDLYVEPDATPLPDTLAELGAVVYEANCVQCHGVDGDGQGSAAPEFEVAPTDFRRQQPTLNVSLSALRDGVAGTRMAVWSDRLSAAELLAVAHHVRSLYTGDVVEAAP